MQTASVIFAKFHELSKKFENFQKLRETKESGKMLDVQGWSTNLSPVYHVWPKLSFLIKSKWFGYVWKVSSDFDLIWLSRQINKDSKQKGHESSIGEILDTLQKQ